MTACRPSRTIGWSSATITRSSFIAILGCSACSTCISAAAHYARDNLGALSRRAVNEQAATVTFHTFTHRGEPEAAAVVLLVRCLLLKSAAIIADVQRQVLAIVLHAHVYRLRCG